MAGILAISLLLGMAVAAIAAPPEENTVTGKVHVPFRGEIDQALIQAVRRSDGHQISTRTNSTGEYELVLPAGLWSISAVRDTNSAPYSWFNQQPPDMVRFFNDGTSESVEINYDLSPSLTEVSGFIRLPDGSTAPFDVDVTIMDRNGRGVTVVAPAHNGFFFASAADGDLTFSVHPSSSQYLPPDPVHLSLANTDQVNLGTIYLLQTSSAISTTLTNSDGNPVSDIDILAWQTDKRAIKATSGIAGEVNLPLPAGDWWVMPQVPASQPYMFNADPVYVTVEPTSTLNLESFMLNPAPNLISGRLLDLKDGSGALVEQGGTVVAYNAQGDPVRAAQIVSGTFSLYLPDGVYTIHPRFAPNSPYTADSIDAGQLTGGEQKAVVLTAEPAAQSVSVSVWDPREEEFVQNIQGNVIAVNGGGLEQSPLQPNGRFMLDLSAGDWVFGLDYADDLENGTHLPLGHATASSVQVGEPITVEIPVAKIDSAITGRVLDPSGNGLSGAVVHAHGVDQGFETVEIEGRTDATGRYYLQVPHGTYRLWSSAGGPNSQGLVSASTEMVTLRPKAIRPGIDLVYKRSDVTVSGRVWLPNHQPATQGAVVAYTSQGAWVTSTIGANGAYSLPLVAGPTWTLEASQVADQSRLFLQTQIAPQSDQSLDLTLQTDPYQFRPQLFTFDPAQTTEFVINRDFSVIVPAGAVPSPPLSSKAAFLEVVTDRSFLNSYHKAQVGNSYRFYVYDRFGAPIRGQLVHSIIMVHRFDVAALQTDNLATAKLVPGSKNQLTGEWELEPQFVLDHHTNQVIWELQNLKAVSLFLSKSGNKYAYLPLITR